MLEFIPTKLQKIVDNNLSNAIKYSYENSKVIVTLKKDGDTAILGFRDFGIGIRDPDMIFSRYYREDNAKGGFGIGLNIVGKIINEENIKVKIESELTKGAYFEYIFKKIN
jgi:signal transduction histidine kinase